MLVSACFGERCRLPLSLCVVASGEGCLRFRPVLRVRGKTQPLTLSVQADGNAMSARLQLRSPAGEDREVQAGEQPHPLHFGEVVTNAHTSTHTHTEKDTHALALCPHTVFVCAYVSSPPLKINLE